ncbi:MAG: YtxH domain-containing protein [candidate division Zixibacteria bacterium]|nr:YtxH domain-containing protein [candidate division Zixibacteria bacterium]
MPYNDPSNSGSSWGTFLLGAAIGAEVAFLYAPRPGSEVRQMIVDKSKQVKGMAEEGIQSVKNFGKNRMSDYTSQTDEGRNV